MATGFRYRKWDDAGAVKIENAAGSLITVFDDILTNGSSPWTKTINGTNDVTYQAPGGSMIKFHVAQNYAFNTNFLVSLTAQVGTDPVFPTATQKGTTSQGHVVLKCRETSTQTSDYDQKWHAIRTDRFFLFSTASADLVTGHSVIAVGDFPVFSGSDPGLCGLIGGCTTVPTHVSSSQYSFSNSNTYNSPTTSQAWGYAFVAMDGVTLSVPIALWPTLPGQWTSRSIVKSLGGIPLGKFIIATQCLSTGYSLNSHDHVFRGWIPHYRICPLDENGINNEDTFSDGNSSTYRYIRSIGKAQPVTFVTSDDEGLP